MADPAVEIKNTWRIIEVCGNSVLELRAIWPKGVGGSQPPKCVHFYRCDYGSVDELKEAFEGEALRLNRAGFNIYVVMNPIRHDFTGRGAAKDSNAVSRPFIFGSLILSERALLQSPPAFVRPRPTVVAVR